MARPARPHPRRGGARRSAATALVCTVLAASTSGCTSPLAVPVAPHAGDPRCASIVLALPRQLDGMSRLATGSQATVAWGERDAPIVLRCGVDPPPPTTDPCVNVDDGTVAVDWVAVAGVAEDDGAAPWTFTTYGREPAVEVTVPAAVTRERSTSFLVDLGPAVAIVPQAHACL